MSTLTFGEMVSVKEAAGLLGCSRDSVVRMIRCGKLRAVKFPTLGGRGLHITWRILKGEIEPFLRENTTGRTT